jgi:hypothetical protein
MYKDLKAWIILQYLHYSLSLVVLYLSDCNKVVPIFENSCNTLMEDKKRYVAGVRITAAAPYLEFDIITPGTLS